MSASSYERYQYNGDLAGDNSSPEAASMDAPISRRAQRLAEQQSAGQQPSEQRSGKGRGPSIGGRSRSLAALGVALVASVAIAAVTVPMASASDSGGLHVAPTVSSTAVLGSLDDGVVSARVKTDQNPVGGGLYVGLYGRFQHGSGYQAKVRIDQGGAMILSLVRRENGTESTLSSVELPESYKLGEWLNIELAVAGSSPTQLQTRAWLEGSKKPEWQTAAHDENTVTTTGDARLWAYASTTGIEHDVEYDSVNIDGDSSVVTNDLANGTVSTKPSPSTTPIEATPAPSATPSVKPSVKPTPASSNKPVSTPTVAEPVAPAPPIEPSATTDPGTEPIDPGTEPTDPETEPIDPGTEPIDPGTEPIDPGTEPIDPGTEPTDPATEPTEPTNRPKPTTPSKPTTPAKPTNPPKPTTPSKPTTPPKPAPAPPKPGGGGGNGAPENGGAGVPDGAPLKAHRGDITVTKNGTVIDGMDVYGSILVQADNVQIRNTRVRGNAGSNKGLIHAVYGASNLVVENSTLIPDSPSVTSYGVKGWNFTLRRVEVAKAVDSVQIFGDNVRIENSWLHNHIHYGSDPYQGGRPSHNDGIQILKGRNITIAGNTISDAHNAAIQMTQDQGATSQVDVENNTFHNGTCSIKMNHKRQNFALGPVSLNNNKFGRNQSIGGCAILRTSKSNVSAGGNTWVDGSAANVQVDG